MSDTNEHPSDDDKPFPRKWAVSKDIAVAGDNLDPAKAAEFIETDRALRKLGEQESAYRDWNKMLFDNLSIGGVWCYPATGFVYSKVSDTEIELVSIPEEGLTHNWREEHDKVVFYSKPHYEVTDPKGLAE
jgi:hypothetical protein